MAGRFDAVSRVAKELPNALRESPVVKTLGFGLSIPHVIARNVAEEMVDNPFGIRDMANWAASEDPQSLALARQAVAKPIVSSPVKGKTYNQDGTETGYQAVSGSDPRFSQVEGGSSSTAQKKPVLQVPAEEKNAWLASHQGRGGTYLGDYVREAALSDLPTDQKNPDGSQHGFNALMEIGNRDAQNRATSMYNQDVVGREEQAQARRQSDIQNALKQRGTEQGLDIARQQAGQQQQFFNETGFIPSPQLQTEMAKQQFQEKQNKNLIAQVSELASLRELAEQKILTEIPPGPRQEEARRNIDALFKQKEESIYKTHALQNNYRGDLSKIESKDTLGTF